MNPATRADRPTSAHEAALVAFGVDGHRLLLPQREVVSLESVLDLRRTGIDPPAVGLIEWAGEDWPVYCPSGAMLAMTATIPPQRRFCLLLGDDWHRLAILCDQVEMLGAADWRTQPVPTCMAKPDGLIEALIAHRETVDCLTNTARLAAFCRRAALVESRDG